MSDGITDNPPVDQTAKLKVPAAYGEGASIIEKVAFALTDIGRGSAEDVVKNMERLDPGADNKELIAATHQVLTELHKQGQITASEDNGNLVYHIAK
jgi:hypothetical protein